jgi:MFS superfamily sulfate permease-like transporter
MSKQKGIFWNAKGDLMAGLVVFLIALPLCLAIAQASQAPLFSGIVAGVVGGIVIGFLSKSQLSVSGPAAGLVAIVILAIEKLGAFDIFVCAVIIAGALQLLLGILKAGTVATYFPTNVIEGMLAGIGLTIIIKQIPDATGYGNKSEMAGVADAEDGFVLSSITESLQHIELGAVIITLVGLGLLVLWATKGFKKIQLIPAGLVVVVIGTLLNMLFKGSFSNLYLNDTHLVKLPIPESAGEFFKQFKLPNFSGFANPLVWQTGVVIAIVASIETLLCVEATDKLDPLRRNTSGNSELVAQGAGNIISGFLGGLPITSVIVRSSANINAGAKTKLSAIVHGVLLLVCVATIPVILNYIPKAALAAILIFTGYRLARPAIWKHMWHAGRQQFIPFVATALAVVATDLLKGVALGLIISIFYILRQNLKTPYFFNRSEYKSGNDIIRLQLAQEVSFLNKASIKLTLGHLPENSVVVLDANNTVYIDYDVLEEIKEFRDYSAPARNIQVKFLGFKKEHGITNTHKEDQDNYASYEDFMENYLKIK